jgi:hypothetical protein
LATLHIRRTTKYPDRFRKYRLFVDGEPVGRIGAGRELEVGVAPGRHEIVARIDWCSSNTLELNVQVGDVRTLEVGSNMTGWRLMGMKRQVLDRSSEYLFLREA